MEKVNFNFLVTSEQSFDPVSYQKMKVDAINSTSGDLTGYNCPQCLNRGYVAVAREDGTLFMQGLKQKLWGK